MYICIYVILCIFLELQINMIKLTRPPQPKISVYAPNGKVVGDLMTPAPRVVHESTDLEDAARYYFFLFLMLLSRVLCEFVSVYVQFSVTSYFLTNLWFYHYYAYVFYKLWPQTTCLIWNCWCAEMCSLTWCWSFSRLSKKL